MSLPPLQTFSPEATFRNVTKLWYEFDPTENTWKMLLCMPSLLQLTIGNIKSISFGARPPPPAYLPVFALEHLTVFGPAHNYSWILHSSSVPLRHLTLHYVSSGWYIHENVTDLRTALERCGKSIRHLYSNSNNNAFFPTESILGFCPYLQSFKVALTDVVMAGTHTHLDLAFYLSGLQQPLEHLHLAYGPNGTFIDTDGVKTVGELVEGHPILQGLKRLCIGACERLLLREESVDMRPLRRICPERGILLNTLSDEEIDAGWNVERAAGEEIDIDPLRRVCLGGGPVVLHTSSDEGIDASYNRA